MAKKQRNIKGRIVHAALYSRTLMHIKHYRGNGVHSPFVYGVIRNAIMKHDPEGEDHTLYDELRKRGFSKRRAAQLQNLYSFQNFTSAPFAEEAGKLPALDSSTLCLVMPSFPEQETLALAEKAKGSGAALCIVSPRISRSRYRMSKRMVDEHRHTSVDNRGFLLLFTNERLPKQHFKL